MQLEFGPVKLKAKKHKLPKLKVKGYSSSSSSSSDSSSDSDWRNETIIFLESDIGFCFIFSFMLWHVRTWSFTVYFIFTTIPEILFAHLCDVTFMFKNKLCTTKWRYAVYVYYTTKYTAPCNSNITMRVSIDCLL